MLSGLQFFNSFSEPYQVGVSKVYIGKGDTIYELSSQYRPDSLVLEEYIWFVKQANKSLLSNQKGRIYPGDVVYMPIFENGSKVELFFRHFSNDYYNNKLTNKIVNI